jgi:pantoate--beta-alanine ligase
MSAPSPGHAPEMTPSSIAGAEARHPAPALVRRRDEIRAARSKLREPVGLVPTMGALHAGHDSLVRAAREECASVIATIFVNPAQFAPGEDFARYPRNEAADLERLAALGVDLVFAPSIEEMYPRGFATQVDPGPLGNVLEGVARPGHFRGVATVVAILLDLAAPQRAYFGQKDGQQAIVVRRVARDLALPVDIRVLPTVREPDGLAVSSRNVYLSKDERAAAPVLYRALTAVADACEGGERNAETLRRLMTNTVSSEPLARLEYASVADVDELAELDTVDRPALASLAVRFPSTRLIDCLVLD